MRSGKIKIKKYKTGRRRPKALLLFAVLAVAAGALVLLRPPLPFLSFSAPSLTRQDTEMETRVVTLPAARFYTLQLGAFSDARSAESLAETYRRRGAAGYIHHQDSYRVLAAAYPQREDALAVQQQLLENHQVDAYLHPVVRNAVTLRLSGQKAQLDALEDAFDICVQLTATLAHLSQSLDGGTMTADEIRAALPSQLNTLQSLCSRLETLFARENHAAVLALLTLMQETQAHLQTALTAENSTRLGGSIKYCHLALLCGLEAYVAQLAPG